MQKLWVCLCMGQIQGVGGGGGGGGAGGYEISSKIKCTHI